MYEYFTNIGVEHILIAQAITVFDISYSKGQQGGEPL